MKGALGVASAGVLVLAVLAVGGVSLARVLLGLLAGWTLLLGVGLLVVVSVGGSGGVR